MVTRSRMHKSGSGSKKAERLKREAGVDCVLTIDRETGKLVKFPSIDAVLREINRDRSGEWTRYDKTDWRDGLENFTEYKLIAVMRNGRVIRDK
jgi:hypothetical protein